LSYRRGISNVIIPNVFDFESPAKASPNGRELRKEAGLGPDDFFVLQPTRVVPRKWIERAVELVKLLNIKNPRLVVSHESGDEGGLYAKRIVEYARNLGVDVVYMGDKIGSERCFNDVCEKKFTIDDVYLASDLIAYPSGYEGFGNAFLEAIYFKKPIVVNRYSIFIEDIEPCGFAVIPFEGFVTQEVVERIRQFIEPDNLNSLIEKNYELGRKYFSYQLLEKKLVPILESFH
jgi:glycosyltransferase involved in cell wall biosynthesis